MFGIRVGAGFFPSTVLFVLVCCLVIVLVVVGNDDVHDDDDDDDDVLVVGVEVGKHCLGKRWLNTEQKLP